MERTVMPRPIFSYLEDAGQLGTFVRCPLHHRPIEVFDCVTCAHYRGIETSDRRSFRVRCTEQDPERRGPTIHPSCFGTLLPSAG